MVQAKTYAGVSLYLVFRAQACFFARYRGQHIYESFSLIPRDVAIYADRTTHFHSTKQALARSIVG